MKHSDWWLVAGLMILGLPLTACQRLASTTKGESPASVVHIDGSKLNRVTLTEKAIERIALKTDQVREQLMSRSSSLRMVVPYSSLIYDAQGDTWVYVSPQPRTFVRHKVDVDYIEGEIAVLNDGPPAGTVVASVGVAELYGTDSGVGH
jgi:hypothetical protein